MVKKRPDADRRLRQADRLARILRVLQLIQSRGRWDVRTIAAELERSERTVHRDLKVLELAGVPWHFDQDEKCYRKLAAASPEATSKLLADAEEIVAVFNLQVGDQGRHAETIRTVQWALLKHKQLTGQYASPYEPQSVKLTLHPYRLALIKAAWYLIGQPLDGDQPRTYRIGRFKALRMTDAPAEIPSNFDLKHYLGNAWGVYRGDRSYDVEIAFTKEAATIVTETIWHHTQKVHRRKDGGVALTFRVDGLNEIIRWVIGWSSRATVVKPPELRSMVVEQLRTALKMHES